MKSPRVTESDVAAACDSRAIAAGWIVERYEQRRATMITEGLPDRRYVHRGRGLRVWVEVKRPGGKLTTAQHRWLLDELEAGALATAIDHPDQLTRLLQILARRSASLETAARDQCRAWVDVIWQRGPRDTVPRRAPAAAQSPPAGRARTQRHPAGDRAARATLTRSRAQETP
jgi:hypothetical protein